MLNRMIMKNFRGIRETKLDDLSRINVLIGKNNCGKSTILEALSFIRASLRPVDELERPLLAQLLKRRIHREALDIREFFYQYKGENKINFEALCDDATILIEASYAYGRIQYKYLIPKTRDILADISLPPSNTVIDWRGPQIGTSTTADFVTVLKQFEKRESSDKLFMEAKSYSLAALQAFEFLSNLVLVDAEFIRDIEAIERVFWGEILESRTDKQLKNALNETYNTEIEHFTLGSYQRGKYKLFMALPEVSIHIDDYGEGFRYAFAILTIASQLKNTALLLEEPEVHQHVGAMKPFFEALYDLIKANNLQIFISTHSLDLLDMLIRICDEDLRIFHLELNSNGILQTRTLKVPDTRLMMDLGVDLRRIGEPTPYLIFEGNEDRVFLEAIAKKFVGKSLKDFYMTFSAPKDDQKVVVSSFASTGKAVMVLRDCDKELKMEETVKPFVDSLKSRYEGVEVKNNKLYVRDTGSNVTIIPMGLPNDLDLKSIGINRHSMEDYLLKILNIDANVKKWAEVDLKELRKRAESLKGAAKLNSSKTLFGALGVIKGQETEDLIKNIIENASKKTLTPILKPLLDALFLKSLVK